MQHPFKESLIVCLILVKLIALTFFSKEDNKGYEATSYQEKIEVKMLTEYVFFQFGKLNFITGTTTKTKMCFLQSKMELSELMPPPTDWKDLFPTMARPLLRMLQSWRRLG